MTTSPTSRRDLALACGAILGLLGVAAGAFGAHALRGNISPERLDVWRTATAYAQLHAAVLVAVALAAAPPRPRPLQAAIALFIAGIVVFSGSLVVLVLADLAWLGAVTPLGGLAMMGGWLCLLVFALRRRR